MDKMLKDSPYYQKILDSKFTRILISVDKQISNNIINGAIATRPSASNGLWCCLLLPTVLIVYSIMYPVSELYIFLTYISIGLLSYSFLFIAFMSVSCLVLKEKFYGGCEASSFVATLLIYGLQGQGIIFSLTLSVIAVCLYSAMLRLALTDCPQTFTIGEAMVVGQSIALSSVMAICVTLYDMGDKQDEEMQFINSVNFTILSSVGIIVTALSVFRGLPKTLAVLGYLVSIAGTYALMILHVQVGVDCIVKIVAYIVLDIEKLKLIFFWAVLVGIAVVVVLMRTKLNVKASTVTRKTFHVLASLVFLTGIVYDIKLMYLATGVGFAALILVEALRKSGIETISPALQAAFLVYSDEKDSGCFAMTPIYLYVGLACPLLLVPIHSGFELELLSGVLSIGVGDTAASWFGSKYGFNKWADGKKSVEGTVFNILSQVAVVYGLQLFELLDVPKALFRVIVTATISGLVEAKTDQVDNLILPLVNILAFQTTTILNF
ncbi:hypothetical protein PYW08_002611 [Mythimna loreyi]|uniref:Uncharacterized protein n=1 Tax=Mythimna loreyi TaxID=667449 RepID=A0ACC2QIZ1_9NEOP|nr:hypothetical protein PYW08_002611 [Mythimna loreyi]